MGSIHMDDDTATWVTYSLNLQDTWEDPSLEQKCFGPDMDNNPYDVYRDPKDGQKSSESDEELPDISSDDDDGDPLDLENGALKKKSSVTSEKIETSSGEEDEDNASSTATSSGSDSDDGEKSHASVAKRTATRMPARRASEYDHSYDGAYALRPRDGLNKPEVYNVKEDEKKKKRRKGLLKEGDEAGKKKKGGKSSGAAGAEGKGSTKSPYKCAICARRYIRGRDLKEHMKSHTTDACKCGICCKNFTSPRGLNRHMREKHGRVRLACPQCKVFKCVTEETMRAHMIHSHKVSLYKAKELAKEAIVETKKVKMMSGPPHKQERVVEGSSGPPPLTPRYEPLVTSTKNKEEEGEKDLTDDEELMISKFGLKTMKVRPLFQNTSEEESGSDGDDEEADEEEEHKDDGEDVEDPLKITTGVSEIPTLIVQPTPPPSESIPDVPDLGTTGLGDRENGSLSESLDEKKKFACAVCNRRFFTNRRFVNHICLASRSCREGGRMPHLSVTLTPPLTPSSYLSSPPHPPVPSSRPPTRNCTVTLSRCDIPPSQSVQQIAQGSSSSQTVDRPRMSERERPPAPSTSTTAPNANDVTQYQAADSNPVVESPPVTYKCRICHTEFPRVMQLVIHERLDHRPSTGHGLEERGRSVLSSQGRNSKRIRPAFLRRPSPESSTSVFSRESSLERAGEQAVDSIIRSLTHRQELDGSGNRKNAIGSNVPQTGLRNGSDGNLMVTTEVVTKIGYSFGKVITKLLRKALFFRPVVPCRNCYRRRRHATHRISYRHHRQDRHRKIRRQCDETEPKSSTVSSEHKEEDS